MHGEEAATTAHKLLPMSGSVYNVPYHCNGQRNYGGKVPYDHHFDHHLGYIKHHNVRDQS